MFCMHCGKPLPPDAFFCPNCGKKVESAPENAPAGTPAPPEPETPAESPAPPPKLDCGIGLAIVAVVLSQMLGLIGLVFSVLASNTLHSGDYEGARRLAHIGKVWSWTAIILSAIGLFLGILILPGIIQMVFYDQQSQPSGGILSHFLELILPGLRELLN